MQSADVLGDSFALLFAPPLCLLHGPQLILSL
jgi:hypothetical protein